MRQLQMFEVAKVFSHATTFCSSKRVLVKRGPSHSNTDRNDFEFELNRERAIENKPMAKRKVRDVNNKTKT